jgi:acyl carrier protein
MDSIFNNIKELIIKERWEYDFELKPETSLQEDLKIYGDDASEILSKFCNQFSVSYDDFNFDDYFRPEPSWTDFFRSKKKYKQLTLGDLVNATKKGKLE